MSKWDKPAKPVSEEFLQNEQRRRQMIIEASKRRREKEKKLQQLNENMKKNEEQTLERIKRQKQEAYNKYLKNNNMHDKYEQIKRNEKMQEEPKAAKEVSKWKRRDNSSNKNIEGLDLERSHGKSTLQEGGKAEVIKQVNNSKKGTETKKVVAQEFQKQWGEEQQIKQQMIGSKLLDSLDLDIDTMERGRELSDKMERIKKISGDKPTINRNEVDQIKNLIGYDSMLVSFDNRTEQPSVKEPISIKNAKSKPVEKKESNQQETFNNLKHKKEGKILDWANTKVEEADDLFSNCSSNKNIASKAVTAIARENKGSKKSLEPIPEKAIQNKSMEKEKEKKSNQKPAAQTVQAERKGHLLTRNNRSTEKVQREKSGDKVVKIPSINEGRNRSVSKEKAKPTQQALFEKERDKSLEKIRERRYSGERTSSAEKPRAPQAQPQAVPKTQQPFRMNKNPPPIPNVPKPAYTVATHEQYFDVESFIKNDLVHLNEQEQKLQEEIRNLHLDNREKIKEVERKHQIRTDYRTSANLIKKQVNNEEGGNEISSYAGQYTPVSNLNEDLIEDSIQRLDDLLIKKEIKEKEKTHISEQSHIKSIINPLSKPEDLHKQILQLAENISKFEQEPGEDVKGYGYQRKMKKDKGKQDIPEEISVSRNYEEPNAKRADGKKNALKMPNPPILEYSSKNSELVEVNLEEKYFDPEDSLETMNKEKIQVNQKLRNILFD